MKQFENAGPGVQKMFRGALGTVICTVLLLIPVINIIAVIAAVIFEIISIVGLYETGKDIEKCKNAFYLTIANMVLSLLSNLVSSGGVLESLLSIASEIISFLIVYIVCTSLAEVLTQCNEPETAQNGQKTIQLNLVCYVITIVAAIIGIFPLTGIITTLLSVIAAVVAVIAEIMYMIFLNKTAKVFAPDSSV